MSQLCVGKDDHPEAACKHLEDAKVLKSAGRPDGAAYHAGYVVECSLKSVILHDRSWDPAAGIRDAAKLDDWHSQLRKKKYGHDLEAILNATVGPEGARYWPPLHLDASVVSAWSEQMRYWAPTVPADRAAAFVAWADLAAQAVIQMKLDGVV
jgi:hypothetical protein